MGETNTANNNKLTLLTAGSKSSFSTSERLVNNAATRSSNETSRDSWTITGRPSLLAQQEFYSSRPSLLAQQEFYSSRQHK